MPLSCGTGYKQTYVFVPPYLTLNVIFGLTFNCRFVLLCAIFVVAVVIFFFCFGCAGTPLILALFIAGGSFVLDTEKKKKKEFNEN